MALGLFLGVGDDILGLLERFILPAFVAGEQGLGFLAQAHRLIEFFLNALGPGIERLGQHFRHRLVDGGDEQHEGQADPEGLVKHQAPPWTRLRAPP